MTQSIQQTGIILKITHVEEDSGHVIVDVLSNVIEYSYDSVDKTLHIIYRDYDDDPHERDYTHVVTYSDNLSTSLQHDKSTIRPSVWCLMDQVDASHSWPEEINPTVPNVKE